MSDLEFMKSLMLLIGALVTLAAVFRFVIRPLLQPLWRKKQPAQPTKLQYDTAYLDALHHFLIIQWRDATTYGKIIDQHTLRAVQRAIDLVNTLPIVKEYGHFKYVEIPEGISDNWHIRFISTQITINAEG